jgi:hypothetical protein
MTIPQIIVQLKEDYRRTGDQMTRLAFETIENAELVRLAVLKAVGREINDADHAGFTPTYAIMEAHRILATNSIEHAPQEIANHESPSELILPYE